MMYFVLCASLLLAVFLVISLVGSIVTSFVWNSVQSRFEKLSAPSRSDIAFSLLAAPLGIAIAFAAGVIMPAYVLYEPHDSKESVGIGLAIASSTAFVGVAIAAFRVFGSWWTTRRLVRRWINNGERLEIEGVTVPVYKVFDEFPVVAVVGALRPRMFIAEQVLASLSEDETAAAVRHELAHLAALDNLKRLIVRISRDVLIVPIGSDLLRAWGESSEEAADLRATREGGELDLAAALVKIAKIVPDGVAATRVPIGTFLVTEETNFIARRVRSLVRLSGLERAERRESGSVLWPLAFASFILLALTAAADIGILRFVHDITERLVAGLQ